MAEFDFSFLVGDKAGFEDLSIEVMSLPFINILQDLSPQVKKKSDNYVEGAEPGMFFNTGTKEVFAYLDVTVVKFEHTFLRWRPNRGGYFGQFSPEEVLKLRQSGTVFEDTDGSLVDGEGPLLQDEHSPEHPHDLSEHPLPLPHDFFSHPPQHPPDFLGKIKLGV